MLYWESEEDVHVVESNTDLYYDDGYESMDVDCKCEFSLRSLRAKRINDVLIEDLTPHNIAMLDTVVVSAVFTV